MSDEQNPYQAPQAIELLHGYRIAPGEGRPGTAPFASGRVLAFVAMVMIALVVLASLWLAASTCVQIRVLERAVQGLLPNMSDVVSNDSRQYSASVVRQVAYLVSAVTFLMWFYRAYRNLPALGNTHLAHAPSGAVGGWFVPIASLVVPCQIATEIWRGSDPKNIDLKWPQKPRAARFVGCWWGCFLLMCVVGVRASFTSGFGSAQGLGPRSLDSLLEAHWTWLVAMLIALPAGIFAILFIRGVDRNQDERMRVLDERAFVSPSTSTPTPADPRLSAFLDKISSPRSRGDDSPFAPPADRS